MLGSTQLSIHELAQQTTGRLAAAELQFREALVGVDATAVFAAFALNRLSGMSADGAAKHFRPAPASAELAAWLCYPEFGKSDGRDGSRIQAAINAVSEYEEAFALAEVFRNTPEDQQYDELSTHLRLYSGLVRGSAYPSQIYRRIKSVLQPFESELVSFAGVGPCRACEIVRALALQMEDNIQAMRSAFHSVSAEEKTLTEKGDLLTESERVKLANFHNELRRIVSRVEGDWVPTREQISLRVNGLSDTEWEGLANAIGLTPARLAPLSNVVEVQDTPLFFLNSEQVFCVHGGGLL